MPKSLIFATPGRKTVMFSGDALHDSFVMGVASADAMSSMIWIARAIEVAGCRACCAALAHQQFHRDVHGAVNFASVVDLTILRCLSCPAERAFFRKSSAKFASDSPNNAGSRVFNATTAPVERSRAA
jgi:hypothetical protein